MSLSDSQRHRRLPVIDATLPPNEREQLVEALIAQLDLTFDRFTHAPAAEDRYLFFLSAPDFKGDPFCALDCSFPDLTEAQRFYQSRMQDPDDPNPMPDLMIDLEAEERELQLLDYDALGLLDPTGETIEFGPSMTASSLWTEFSALARE